MTSGSSPLHVVHVITGLGQGGAETVLHRLVTAPGQESVHTVISMGDDGVFGDRLRQAGVTVHALHMKDSPLAAMQGAWQLWRLLRRLRPDVVQTWMYHADLVGGLAARLAGVKALAWGIRNSGADLRHGSRSAHVLAWVCARLSRWVPQVIIACAEDAARRHRGMGYDADRLMVIPNGYDLSAWGPDPESGAAARRDWRVEPDELLIGSVARWNPLKDHDTLLAALGRAATQLPKLKCVLVGEGMEPGNAELAALLNRHGVADRVVLLGRRSDVPRILPALDLYVLSSRAEGFPNVVAEAMASGVPCVVTDVGDAARIVGNTGWVVPPRQPAALADAIVQALSPLSSDIGQADHASRAVRAREHVERHFGLEVMRSRYQTVWVRLAKDFPTPQAAQPLKPMPAGATVEPLRRGSSPRLLFLVNNPAFFLSHRLPIALGAREAGYEVHVATMDGPSVAVIREHGFTHHVVPMTRSGREPVAELRSLYAFWRLMRRLKPDLVHAVTIKPVLYGGIAARLAGVPAYVAAVSGLGFIFMRKEKGPDFLRLAATLLYRIALGHRNSRVIFQNQSDREELRHAGVVQPGQAVMIRGSGVDLSAYAPMPEPEGPPVAIMVSRLLRDKGVLEFVEAARLAAGHPCGLRWVLVGAPDPGNPASITESEFRAWQLEGVVECLGERADVAELYQQAHIAVLPSYREGLPRSLVEAAACGRAVVTTDVPGCRDAIEPGVTGILVPVRDARALADAVISLAEDPAWRRGLGEAGRRLAVQAFDIKKVVQAHLAVYAQLLDEPRPAPAQSAS